MQSQNPDPGVPVCRACLQSLFAEPVYSPALAVPLVAPVPGITPFRGPGKVDPLPTSWLCQGLQLNYFCVPGAVPGRQGPVSYTQDLRLDAEGNGRRNLASSGPCRLWRQRPRGQLGETAKGEERGPRHWP